MQSWMWNAETLKPQQPYVAPRLARDPSSHIYRFFNRSYDVAFSSHKPVDISVETTCCIHDPDELGFRNPTYSPTILILSWSRGHHSIADFKNILSENHSQQCIMITLCPSGVNFSVNRHQTTYPSIPLFAGWYFWVCLCCLIDNISFWNECQTSLHQSLHVIFFINCWKSMRNRLPELLELLWWFLMGPHICSHGRNRPASTIFLAACFSGPFFKCLPAEREAHWEHLVSTKHSTSQHFQQELVDPQHSSIFHTHCKQLATTAKAMPCQSHNISP